MRLGGLQINTGVLPSLAAAVMPKCPLCLAGILSTVGFGAVIESRWLPPLTALFLFIALGTLWFRAYRRHGYKPLFLGVLGALLVFAGKFYFDRASFIYLGAALLVGASIWNSIPKREVEGVSPKCRC